MTAERRPVVLITGASSGIGAALAHEFAAHGHELVLIARREQALTAVADAIAGKSAARHTALRHDVGRIDAARDIGEALAQRGLEPEIVVNNAGFGLMGPADKLDRQRQLAMIDVNVRALTELSLAFLESLERRKGGILNVASLAGFMPGPGMAVYYATKAYVLSFSEALHQELKPRGVRVTTLCPGPVPTEFQGRAGIDTSHIPAFLSLSAERVAKEAYEGLKRGRRIVVPGWTNKVAPVLARMLPRAAMLRMIHAAQNVRNT
ncbi:MAG TPA: SDR family oxidoreductase [Xanthobacteraceae bacterium]